MLQIPSTGASFLSDRLFLFFLFPASFHLCAGNIAFFVKKVEVALFSLDAALGDFLGAASLFLSPRHLGAGNIALLIDVIEATFLPFDAEFH